MCVKSCVVKVWYRLKKWLRPGDFFRFRRFFSFSCVKPGRKKIIRRKIVIFYTGFSGDPVSNADLNFSLVFMSWCGEKQKAGQSFSFLTFFSICVNTWKTEHNVWNQVEFVLNCVDLKWKIFLFLLFQENFSFYLWSGVDFFKKIFFLHVLIWF